jgi:hypothetical protein
LKTKHCGNFGTAPSSAYLHLKMGHEASKYYDFIVHVILELPRIHDSILLGYNVASQGKWFLTFRGNVVYSS